MKKKVKVINKRRFYTPDFKKEIVSIFEQGKYSVLQLEKLYGIPNATIYRWIYKYSEFNERGQRVVEMKSSYFHKLKELEKKVKELERIIGQKQIKIDYLEKLIEVAEQEFEIDIKKTKYPTIQWFKENQEKIELLYESVV